VLSPNDMSMNYPGPNDRADGYDVVVLGAGAAGALAAKSARAEGARVALVREAHQAPCDDAGRPSLDCATIRAAGETRWGMELLGGAPIFVSPSVLSLSGRAVRAGCYVIATGSRALRPELAGLPPDRALTLDDIGGLRRLPARLAILGASPQGLETSQACAREGCRVTLLDASPSLLPETPLLGTELERSLSREMDIRLGTRIAGVRLVAEGVELIVTARGVRERVIVDQILFALGRAPHIKHLALERAGVDLFAGTPLVDAYRRTTNPRILVAGDDGPDSAGGRPFGRESEIAGYNAAHPDAPRPVPVTPSMEVVLTDPPYARAGVSEVRARERDGELFVASRAYVDPRDPSAGDATGDHGGRGLVRMWTNRAGKILGGEALGPSADLLAHLIMYAMHFGGTAHDIWRAEQPHPGLAQAVWALADSLVREVREAGGAGHAAGGPNPQALGVVSLTPPLSPASSAGTCSP
jgi:dihydrolipoamide dehydrogenase